MHYTKEEKKAIETLANNNWEYLDYIDNDKEYKDLKKSIEIVVNLAKKQQKEIKILKAQKVVIYGMRSGKSLLRKIARDYTNLALKESELQCISGHSIDCIIDLFKRGYDLISEEEFERYKRIANMNLKDDEEFKNEICNHRCVLKLYLEENYISKEALVNVLNKYAHKPIEETIVINFYKELQKLLGE